MDDFLGVAIGLAGGIAVYEFYVWLPKMNRSIMRGAVQLLPSAQKEACATEWEAHLSEMPNSLVALSESLGFMFSALRFRFSSLEYSIAGWIAANLFLPQFRQFHRDTEKLATEFETDLERFLDDAVALETDDALIQRPVASIASRLKAGAKHGRRDKASNSSC